MENNIIHDRLCHAVLQSDITEIRRLIEKGANPNVRTHCGFLPLTLALKIKSKNAVATLLSLGVDVDLSDEVEGSSILMSAFFDATDFGEPDKLQLLLDAGVPINRLDKDGVTLLMHAAIFQAFGVELFLRRGADPNVRSRKGWTALMYAVETDATMVVEGSTTEIVKLLMMHGADPGLKNPAGETAADIFLKQRYDKYKPTELMTLLKPK
jgi:uncharacterized protein